MPAIKPKCLILCFIRDATKPGEYFVRLSVPNADSRNSMASVNDPTEGELKWIPALDIDRIEPTKDNLGFCIHI